MVALVNFGDVEIITAMRAVLLDLVPTGVDVIRALDNRVPEPNGDNFVVITPLRRERLATNANTDTDIRLTGSIAGTTLTVETGPVLLPGYSLYGLLVAPRTAVVASLADPGTYTVTPAQSVPAGSKLYAGRHAMMQPFDMVYQCDIHGPRSELNAQAISTTWRDERGCELMAAAAPLLGIRPLYADDPRMVAFVNAESQWEDRWIVDLHLQANIVVELGQEFAEVVEVEIYPTDLVVVPEPIPH